MKTYTANSKHIFGTQLSQFHENCVLIGFQMLSVVKTLSKSVSEPFPKRSECVLLRDLFKFPFETHCKPFWSTFYTAKKITVK